MGLKFIDNVIITTLIFAGLCSAATFISFDAIDAIALFAGAAWGSVSLWLFKALILKLYNKTYDRTAALIFMLKFPLLYAVGYFLLNDAILPQTTVLLGFLILFVIMFIHGFAAAMTKRSTLLFFALTAAPQLSASIDADVPEIPNIIGLLYQLTDGAPWAAFLHHWEYIVFSLIVSIGISLLFIAGARAKGPVPTGLENFLEWIVEKLRNFIIEVLGPEGEKFVPFLGTLFIFILCMNWLVLIPLMKPPSSSISITVALAICVFVLVQYLNIKNYGFFGFLYHLAGSPKTAISWALVPLLFVIELLTQLTRPVTLSLRLFGNVVGEDILIGAFALFGVLLISGLNAPVGLPLQIPFLFLALLTGLMQALVFTLLSTVYILLSLPSPDEH
jgi:F-type H+-transporting ATPase subunit a